ncbi:hypothetical protein PIB30_061619 [Stylosanthes scabra]|uniref:PB1-like domain-containing protein n=1 Tax=Stylosanthes scabra TaxID=79078 RepID=A0ABU6ZJM5_9FABA|nr:hypothetical protein [Stylosanthes scabra]
MEHFSVLVHHGGKFRGKVGKGKYVDGEEEMVDWCDRDKWSLLEVYDMLKRIGYLEENIDSLWYKSGGIGLKKLCVDRDAMELANVGIAKGIVELYVVHKLSVLVPDDVGVEAHDAAETGPSVGVEAHDGVECGPNVNLEAQNIEVEIEGAAEVGVKSDGMGQRADDNVESEDDSNDEDDPDYEEYSDLYFSDSEDDFCGDDDLFHVEITLGEFQQEIKENK